MNKPRVTQRPERIAQTRVKTASTSRIGVAAALAMLTCTSFAHEIAVVKVTSLEPSAMPTSVSFTTTAGTPSCVTGSWMSYQKTADANKAMYALLLSAVTSGAQIRIFINEGTCVADHIHLLAS